MITPLKREGNEREPQLAIQNQAPRPIRKKIELFGQREWGKAGDENQNTVSDEGTGDSLPNFCGFWGPGSPFEWLSVSAEHKNDSGSSGCLRSDNSVGKGERGANLELLDVAAEGVDVAEEGEVLVLAAEVPLHLRAEGGGKGGMGRGGGGWRPPLDGGPRWGRGGPSIQTLNGGRMEGQSGRRR